MTRQRLARNIAAISALITGGALILQFVLIAHVLAGMGYGLLVAAWIYFSYFTMFANLFAFALLLHAAIAPEGRAQWANDRARLCIAAAMIVGGCVYTLLMRPILNPQGLQNIADILLHYVTPAVFVAFFYARGAGGLRWRDALLALILPITFCVYLLAREPIDGWRPYPFLDTQALSITQLALNIVGMGAAFWLCALALIALAKWTAPDRF